MKTALMVAEKPWLAASLAGILSNGKCSSRRGLNGWCSVHEWTGIFSNMPVRFKMTSVYGHVMSLDFTSKYNNWDKVDPIELFSCPVEKKEAMPKLKMPYFLSQEARGCDFLILWLDCDKEGENICYEVMSCVQNSMTINVYSDIVTYRAKFSAITEKDIKAAFNNLGHPNENEARSVDARQELDLRIGCAFTRFQTIFFQGRYGNLDASLISYDPCQTPTLGFCVQRHDEIQTFKPEPYWVLQMTVKSKEGREITLDWQRVRCVDKEVIGVFFNIVKDIKQAKVISVTCKEKVKSRPIALNTVELMRVASSGLGMGPHQAMQIAERLYTQGYISYPRTETTSYPENFDLIGALHVQQNSPDWGPDVRILLSEGISRPKKGHDAGDHPPITPMKLATRNEIDGSNSWKLYDYITRHFVGSLSRDCRYLSTTATLEVATELFSTSGKTLIDPGYTNVMHWQAFGKNEIVPTFSEGEIVIIHDVKITEHQTCPPDYLSEAELITLMEQHGIGTDASIPVHINNICQRNYVTVSGSRRLIPTTLGIVLVHGYQKIDPELVLPTMRSAVEEQLNLIALGRANFNAVLNHTVEIFKLKFQYCVKNIEGMLSTNRFEKLLSKMKTALMVAEKPWLAASLAGILSNGKCSSRRGLNGWCSVHEWTGIFSNMPVRFKMTSVYGHVMSLDFTSKYNNWDKVDPIELFSCPVKKKEAMPKLKMPYFLSQEARGCDFLILWLDCDKEGENICYEVMSCVQNSMTSNVYSDIVTYRAKFSAITEKDIKAAFNNLGHPNENEARSVDARQELDLRIGCAFTRFQTNFFQGRYGNLDASLISYDPCQTPTLGFCVQRHDEIQTFKPEPYWVLQMTVKSKEGREVTLDWQRVRCFDKEVIGVFFNIVKDIKQAKVISVTCKEKVKSRPIALNTVELMRVASSELGMGPHYAMQIAERLYTQGYISYPRTETTSYPENFDLIEALHVQQNSPDWGPDVRILLSEGISRPKKGHDAGDHPPITPMKLATRNEIDGSNSWKLYDYITRHFVGSLSRDCRYLSTTATLEVATELFSTSGKTLIDPGYTNVMHWQAFGKNEIVPTFSEGEIVIIHDVKITEHQTCPPDYLSEAELITLMEQHGIGTDASIPVHINNICQRNYVTVSGSRRLIPTTLGIVLVHGYQKIDPELVLPTMRSAVEEQLNLIALGRANFNAVLNHTVEIFKLKFQYFVKNIEGMDQLFEVSFSPLSASRKAHSRCGKCRRYMIYIQAKPARLHCPHCDETYSLPQNGNVRLYKELKCPLDDFELLSWSMGTKGKSFPFCPYCYNHPPFRDMKKGSGCNTCTHPTCAHSLNSNGVSSCTECDGGVLVLDPSSAPKWKLACNKCDVIIHVFEDSQKITVQDDVCDCGAQLVVVEYRPDKSKLPKEATEMAGCVFCSDAFSKLVEKHKAVFRPKSSRGGGKSGRRRCRRKPRQPNDKMAQFAGYFV